MTGIRKVGYFTSWSIYARNYFPANVPVERLTHLNYGFAKLVDSHIELGDAWADTDKPFEGSSDKLKGNFGEFNNENSPVRQRNPKLRTLISVGGWTWSGGFSAMASSPSSRAEFVRSAGDFLIKYGFDGIDIDWEHPVKGGMDGNGRSPDDGHNYLLLLQELRSYFDQLDPQTMRFGRYEISIATSAAPSVYRHLDLAAIGAAVDHINIMTYDYAGPWSSRTAHQQNLFRSSVSDSEINGHSTVDDYINRGVPPHKVVLGVGLYGRGFSNVNHSESPNPNLPGLGCSFSGTPKGTWEEGGAFDYKHLRAQHLRENSGYTVHWDDEAKAPVLYGHNDRVLITYDDQVSISWKADYVRKRQLGGIMLWETSQDSNNELIDKICDYLGR